MCRDVYFWLRFGLGHLSARRLMELLGLRIYCGVISGNGWVYVCACYGFTRADFTYSSGVMLLALFLLNRYSA